MVQKAMTINPSNHMIGVPQGQDRVILANDVIVSSRGFRID